MPSVRTSLTHPLRIDAIGAVDPNVTLNNCALLGDAASCALVKRTANGFINEIDGTLGNLDKKYFRIYYGAADNRAATCPNRWLAKCRTRTQGRMRKRVLLVTRLR